MVGNKTLTTGISSTIFCINLMNGDNGSYNIELSNFADFENT